MRLDCVGNDTDHLSIRNNEISPGTSSYRIVSLRSYCRSGTDDDGEDIYEETEIWLDEERARKLFNWLAVWLHGKVPNDDD